MIGGAKGVGKTRLTLEASIELGLTRIETGKIVLDYVSKGLPLEALTDYLSKEICSSNDNIILDTHYARYSDKEEPNKQFQRGLEPEDLKKLSKKFNIFPCLVEVQLSELEQRRKNDTKRRVINPSYILQENEFNRRGYGLYLTELNKEPFILINDIYIIAKDKLVRWIKSFLISSF